VLILESIELIQNVENRVKENKELNLLKLTIKSIIKNPGSQIKKNFWNYKYRISNYLNENLAQLSLEDISYFKYVPIVLANVERRFLKYKVMLCDNCRSF